MKEVYIVLFIINKGCFQAVKIIVFVVSFLLTMFKIFIGIIIINLSLLSLYVGLCISLVITYIFLSKKLPSVKTIKLYLKDNFGFVLFYIVMKIIQIFIVFCVKLLAIGIIKTVLVVFVAIFMAVFITYIRNMYKENKSVTLEQIIWIGITFTLPTLVFFLIPDWIWISLLSSALTLIVSISFDFYIFCNWDFYFVHVNNTLTSQVTKGWENMTVDEDRYNAWLLINDASNSAVQLDNRVNIRLFSWTVVQHVYITSKFDPGILELYRLDTLFSNRENKLIDRVKANYDNPGRDLILKQLKLHFASRKLDYLIILAGRIETVYNNGDIDPANFVQRTRSLTRVCLINYKEKFLNTVTAAYIQNFRDLILEASTTSQSIYDRVKYYNSIALPQHQIYSLSGKDFRRAQNMY